MDLPLIEDDLGEPGLTVEMEASALLAVARFRGVALSQVLMAGDSLAGETWDDRGWSRARDARAALFAVALDAARAAAAGAASDR